MRVTSNHRTGCAAGQRFDRTVVIHNISLPPGRFGGDAIEALFTNRIDPADHPSFASLAGCGVAHFLIPAMARAGAVRSCTRRAPGMPGYRPAGRERRNTLGRRRDGRTDPQALYRTAVSTTSGPRAALRTAYPSLCGVAGHGRSHPAARPIPDRRSTGSVLWLRRVGQSRCSASGAGSPAPSRRAPALPADTPETPQLPLARGAIPILHFVPAPYRPTIYSGVVVHNNWVEAMRRQTMFGNILRLHRVALCREEEALGGMTKQDCPGALRPIRPSGCRPFRDRCRRCHRAAATERRLPASLQPTISGDWPDAVHSIDRSRG